MRSFSYRVPEKDGGMRLQDFLQRRHGYSHRLIVELKRGGMAVNGEHRRMVDPVFPGDLVEISFPEEPCALVPNGRLAVPVLYEDEDLVIFDKPANMSVHPAADGVDDSLGNFFAYRYQNALTFRPVSRLDKNTTGLCMSAKSTLSAGFLIGQVEKEYLAVAQGVLPEEGTVDVPIGRVEGSIILRKPDPDGQRAVTHYRVLRRTEEFSLLSLRLETGRTHQIRVHMAYIGHPLAGDSLYGGSTERIARQALHCGRMSFVQPFTRQPVTVLSPLPEDMEKLMEGSELLKR